MIIKRLCAVATSIMLFFNVLVLSFKDNSISFKLGQSITASADDTENLFNGGSGTQEDPYLISSATRFKKIEEYPTAYYRLENDLNLSSTERIKEFKGFLDGNGHTVKIRQSATYGLVDNNDGTIKNIKISFSNYGRFAENDYYFGTIANRNGETGIIENCSTPAVTLSTYGNHDIGGIVGFNWGKILKCENQISFVNSDSMRTALSNEIYGYSVGGIAGFNYGEISSCINRGNIDMEMISKGYGYFGGISGTGTVLINNCVTTGNVTADHSRAAQSKESSTIGFFRNEICALYLYDYNEAIRYAVPATDRNNYVLEGSTITMYFPPYPQGSRRNTFYPSDLGYETKTAEEIEEWWKEVKKESVDEPIVYGTASLELSDINCVVGKEAFITGVYKPKNPNNLEEELSNVQISVTGDAEIEVDNPKFILPSVLSSSDLKEINLSIAVRPKTCGQAKVSVQYPNSGLEPVTANVSVEPELVLPGETVGNMYNHYACMTVDCSGAEDIVTKRVTFDVVIERNDRALLTSFLNKIKVNTLDTDELTEGYASYKSSYIIANDNRSAKYIVDVTCPKNTIEISDYISVSTPAQEKIIRVTRDCKDHSQPLAISVFGDTSVQVDTWIDHVTTFKISADIKNVDTLPKTNAYVTIDFPNTMYLLNRDNNAQNRYFSELMPNENKSMSWEICVPYNILLGDYTITIKCGADSIPEKKVVRTIKLNGSFANDNRIDWGSQDLFGNWSGIDNLAFVNANSLLLPSAGFAKFKSEYTLLPEHYAELTEKMSNTVINNLDEHMRPSEWGGACYGMSNVVSLMKAGYLTPSYWQSDATVPHDLDKPINNKTIESLINFYQLQQYLPDVVNDFKNFTETELSWENLHRQLINEVKKVKYGGLPVVISFMWEEDGNYVGHAVVAYDVDEGDFIAENDEHYRYRVSICDPNETRFTYMYFKEDLSSNENWYYHPMRTTTGITKKIDESQKYIKYVFSDLSKIDLINPEKHINRTVLHDYNEPFINYKNNSIGTIIASNGKSTSLSRQKIDDKLNISVIPTLELKADGSSSGSGMIFINDNSDSFAITPKKDELYASLIFDNTMLSVSSDNVQKATYSADGSVSVDLCNGSYNISGTYNENIQNMPWFTVNVNGSNTNCVSLSWATEGIILSSDNLNNIQITAKNLENEKSVNFSTDRTSVLIDDVNEDTLGIYIDTDNNGTYETLIADSNNSVSTVVSVTPKFSQNESKTFTDITLTVAEKTYTADSTGKIAITDLVNGTFEAVVYKPNYVPEKITLLIGGDNSDVVIYKYGDLESNGEIDINDLILMQKVVAGWKVTINEAAADVNCDGEIDINDLILMQKSIAGWKVKLGNDTSSDSQTEFGEISHKAIEEEHIQPIDVSEDNTVYYMDNQLILAAKEGVQKSEIEALVESVGGKIVGYLEIVNYAQIEFDSSKTKTQLEAIAEDLKSSDLIEDAYINWVTTDTISGVSDINLNCQNNLATIKGTNVDKAWKYMNNHSNIINLINVGLIDSCFDTNHKDLGFAWVSDNNESKFIDSRTAYNNRFNETDENKREKIEALYFHGTHVAGILAANGLDGQGTNGIYPYSTKEQSLIYGISENRNIFDLPLFGDGYDFSVVDTMGYMSDIATLVSKNVKVINYSLSFYGNERSDDYYKCWANHAAEASKIGNMLDKLLEYRQFIIVAGAGNASDYSTIRDCKAANIYSLIDENHNCYSNIIIVGNATCSVTENGIYYYRDTHSCGGNRLDIFAPGCSIYSTVPGNENGSYGIMSGTSMASPFIAGICADVWSMNNALSGSDVKKIICNSIVDDKVVYIKPNGVPVGIIDCEKAVKEAIEKKKQNNNFGSISGHISFMTDIIDVDDPVIQILDRSNNVMHLYYRDNYDTLDDDKMSWFKNENLSENHSSNPFIYDRIPSKTNDFIISLPQGEWYTIALSEESIEQGYEIIQAPEPFSIKPGKVTQGINIVVKKNGSSQLHSEQELRNLVESAAEGTISEWAYYDYDGDGNKEAFAVIAKNENTIKSIYFVDCNGNVTKVRDTFWGAFFQYNGIAKNEIDGRHYFAVLTDNGGSGSRGYIFGVVDGQPKEFLIGVNYDDYSIIDNKLYAIKYTHNGVLSAEKNELQYNDIVKELEELHSDIYDTSNWKLSYKYYLENLNENDLIKLDNILLQSYKPIYLADLNNDGVPEMFVGHKDHVDCITYNKTKGIIVQEIIYSIPNEGSGKKYGLNFTLNNSLEVSANYFTITSEYEDFQIGAYWSNTVGYTLNDNSFVKVEETGLKRNPGENVTTYYINGTSVSYDEYLNNIIDTKSRKSKYAVGGNNVANAYSLSDAISAIDLYSV